MKVGIRIVHCPNVRTGGRHDITNISFYRFSDGDYHRQHDCGGTVGYVEKIGRRVMSATVVKLSEYKRDCKNCVYLDEDSCTCPNGWFLDDKNRCAQFKRKQKQEGE